jgi:hypothetical protein
MPNWKKLIVSGSDAALNKLNVANAVTASYFKGDGSALTGITVGQSATVTQDFINTANINVLHGFNSRNVLVSVYDHNYEQLIPSKVKLVNTNLVNIHLAESSSGLVVIAKGGHIVSGSSETAISASYALTASYALNAGGGAGVGFPFSGSAVITGSLFVSGGIISGDGSGLTNLVYNEEPTVVDTFTETTTKVVNHNFNTKNVIVSVYDDNDTQVIPNSVVLTDNNNVTVNFTVNKSGTVVVAKGGHVVYGSTENTILFNSQSADYFLNYNNLENKPAFNTSPGIITFSGSLLPSSTELFDLGTPSQRWRDLYLSGSTIFLDTTSISKTPSGDIEIKDHNNQRRNIIANQIHLGGSDGDDLVIHEQNGKIRFKNSRTNQKVEVDNTAATASFAERANIANIATTAVTASFALNAGGGDSRKEAIYSLVGLSDMYYSKAIIS